jgi:hypothetical protein
VVKIMMAGLRSHLEARLGKDLLQAPSVVDRIHSPHSLQQETDGDRQRQTHSVPSFGSLLDWVRPTDDNLPFE